MGIWQNYVVYSIGETGTLLAEKSLRSNVAVYLWGVLTGFLTGNVNPPYRLFF